MSYENIENHRRGFAGGYVGEVIRFRHLAWNLVGSDLRAKFRRSYLGILWAVLQPLGFSLIIGLVWGGLFDYPSVWGYALYVFSGMIVWEYFATIMNVSQDALINAQGYMKQTRIPFFIFQVRTATTGLVIFFAGVVGLIALQIAMGRPPPLTTALLLVPVYFVVLFAFMAPLSVIMSILGTKFRDLKYITGLAVQALFFLSPVMLVREIFAEGRIAILDWANPMAQLIHMFRDPIMDGKFWTLAQVGATFGWISAFWIFAWILSAGSGRRIVFSL